MRVKYEERRIAVRPISILVIWSHEVLQCQDLARREERPWDDGDTDIDIEDQQVAGFRNPTTSQSW